MEFLIVIFSLFSGFVLISISGVVSYLIINEFEFDGMFDSMGAVIFLKSVEFITLSYLIYAAFRGSL